MTALSGKVCVVTGASSGIGEATARALARAGATVVLAARREERLQALAGEIRANGREALTVRCDVTVKRQVAALAEEVESKFGRCDVLVNNAGIPGGGPFADVDLKQLERVVATNFLGVLYCTKTFLPLLRDSRGHVVNVASLGGRYALPGHATYCATKHAVVGFSEALYHELKPEGVMVTVVNPGFVTTEGFPQEEIRNDRRYGRLVMPPERIGRAIVDVVRRRKGPEVSVPGWLASGQAVRVLAPPLYRAGMSRLVARRTLRSPK